MNFDDKAQTWDADPIKQERARAVAAAMRQGIPLRHDWHALEYGCGTGLLSFALLSDFAQITLADNSTGMLAVLDQKIAAAGASHLQSLALDLSTDALPAARYDLIYTLLTMHHVADIDRLLRAFHDLLQPGGWLAIADLDAEDGSFHGPGFVGHNGFDRPTLQNQLVAVGFDSIDFSTCYVMKKPSDQGMRDYPLFLAVATRS